MQWPSWEVELIAAEDKLRADERELARKEIPPAMWPDLLDEIEASED